MESQTEETRPEATQEEKEILEELAILSGEDDLLNELEINTNPDESLETIPQTDNKNPESAEAADTGSAQTIIEEQEQPEKTVEENKTEPEKIPVGESGDFRVKGSGRHKLDCQCIVCKQRRAKEEKHKHKPTKQATATGATDASKNLFDDLSEYREKPKNTTGEAGTGAPPPPPPPPPPPAPGKIDGSKVINGALFLIVMDAAFPVIIKTLLSLFEPKYKRIKHSSKEKLKLTPDEKRELEAGANEIVKYLFSDANPLLIFAVSVGFIYYEKFDSLTDEDFSQPRKPEQRREPEKKTTRKK